jgi:glycosyltransferase involved in cell wall biosynthesis
MKPILTVFTPAYNRADLLPRCYESMRRQTNQNFIWMIIDDGSTDNTREIVHLWQQENTPFKVEYYYKENGGLHTAYNEAIKNIETPLCVCIDSDDFMPDDAIEKILSFWKANASDKYAGIVGLDYYLNGNVIGDKLPNLKSINLIDLMLRKYKIKNGDRTIVVRTELYKKHAPMKIFPGEKNFNPHYMHLQISKEYDFLVLNENLRFVEYQPNGMSHSMLKQYTNSPRSFAESRKLYLNFVNTPFLFKFRHSIHLVSSCILYGNIKDSFKGHKHKFIVFLALPSGWMLSKYIRFHTKSNRSIK